MSHSRRGLVAKLTLVLTGIAIAVMTPTSVVLGHGVLDQTNIQDIIGVFSCGGNGDAPPIGLGRLYQSFVLSPQATHLVAVDVGLSRGGSFPAEGTTTEINVRADDPFGSILGTSVAFVPAGPNEPVHFELDPPIPVVPGDTYLIEWIVHDQGPMWLSWRGHRVDSYPPGEAFHCSAGTYDPTVDFNFNAYRQATVPCCLPDDSCIEVLGFECEQQGGAPGEPGATCAEHSCTTAVPAVSGWGLAALTAILLAASVPLLRRFRISSGSPR